jgi:chromosome condensin MukBEF complex kleisin-like MukF subunit
MARKGRGAMTMQIDQINALRLQAFKTNFEADIQAYYEACSHWFQSNADALAELRAENLVLHRENEDLRGFCKGMAVNIGKMLEDRFD